MKKKIVRKVARRNKKVMAEAQPEPKVFKTKEEVKELVDKYRKKWGKVKVDIGCGKYLRGEDFIPLDRFFEEKYPFMVESDMWDLPFDDEVIDEIWCSHVLEHAPLLKVIATLKEFLRVLRIGGDCVITVPDFDYVAKYWLTGADRSWAELMVVGIQSHEGEFHKCCFNADLIRGDLAGVGFEIRVVKLVWSHNQDSIEVVAVKPNPPQIPPLPPAQENGT